MTRIYVLLIAVFFLPLAVLAQHTHPEQRAIAFPDGDAFLTLTCDLHMHTVFSDGSVWPDIRVREAQRDGLDCIAMTEHLEYQPHAEDIPHPDRNRAWQIASGVAEGSELIVLNGSEITRSMPPGHSNAIFVQDANALLVDDARTAFEAAGAQNAFVFWNHPNWTSQRSDGMATLTDMHRALIEDDLLHGIEVVNETTYSEEAFQIALDHDLAIIGTSDIHGLVDWLFEIPQGGHRPLTLVLASERSSDGIREALVARRTVAYFNETLIGREAHVRAVAEASLSVASAAYPQGNDVLGIELRNDSDATWVLVNQSPYTLHEHADLVIVEPHSSARLGVKTGERLSETSLSFDVVNALVAPGQHLRLELPVRVQP